ncbi:MAG TPA: TetR/AcrR family transcriptional regulator [Candidatus Kapabacteria bacterium]|nr:TetR/AcrR family transcriptional regulator [Candidatus Kapabacteria bacterium]
MPRTAKQLVVLKEKKREVILEAALRVFADHGYAGSNMDEIAKRARISKGLIYTYFPSKEVLLIEVLRDGLAKIENEFMRIPKANSLKGKEEFSVLVQQWVEMFTKENDFWRLYSMLLLQKGITTRIEKELSGSLESYMEIFIPYFRKKGSSDPVAEAFLFGATLDGVMVDLIVSPRNYPLKRMLKMIIEKFG